LQIQLDPALMQTFGAILQAYQDPNKESHYGAAVGEAVFRQLRHWAKAAGVEQEVAEFVGSKVTSLHNL
jgi:hypothetical protein